EVIAIAPTPSVASRWAQLAPQLAEKAMGIIGHGLSAALIAQLAQVRTLPAQKDATLKVVVLGSMSAHKGADIVKSVLPELAEFCHIWLLGSGEEGAAFRHKKNVTVIPYFER